MNISELVTFWPELLGGAVIGVLISVLVYMSFLKKVLVKHLGSQLEERKDQFIALASHYLLNPITVIQTALARLQENDTELSHDQRSQLYEAILRGQQRLWIVAQQVVLVGEIDQEDLQLRASIGDLPDLITDAMKTMDPFAREKKLKLSFINNSRDLNQFRFDPRRMKQAFIALLDNAIKFSNEGGQVTVMLSMASGAVLNVTIEDQGIGMPAGIVDHLTERFYRGTELYNFDYEGLGLGLHIAKAIFAAHQGTLAFESKEKKGTIAIVSLPLR